MYKCEQCGCMTFDRVEIAGLRVCSYCELDHDKKKALARAAKLERHREYNNLAWLIKLDNKTIRNWAKKHGFSYAVVEQVIHKKGHYAATDIHDMSKQHFNIIMAMCDDGYRDTLVAERYVTHV